MTAHTSSRRSCSRLNARAARICLLVGVTSLLALASGCSGDNPENSDSATPNAAAQPAPAKPAQAAPAAPAQAAPAAPANVASANNEDKPSKIRRKKKKDDDEPAVNTNPTVKPISKPVGEWTIEDLKTALVNKDFRYVEAVTVRAMTAPGDAQKGTEIAQLLDAVAKMPADAGAAALRGRKKRGDADDGPQQPPTDSPAGTVAAPAAPGTPPGNAPPPDLRNFNLGRKKD